MLADSGDKLYTSNIWHDRAIGILHTKGAKTSVCRCVNSMRTPLNYTGNKSRLVERFKSKFPVGVDVFVDLFCGGGTVGLSIDAKKVIFIDNNKNVIELLKHLSKYRHETLLKRLEKLIRKYNLSYSAKFGYTRYRKGVKKGDNNGLKKYNKKGFCKLREDYNHLKNKFTKNALDMLYLLVVYGFNNDMRFNRSNEYNLPIGKTDLNKNNLKKIEAYITRVEEIDCEFVCGDFRDREIKEILFSSDFIYADPPYLLGSAVYNENANWTRETEQDLVNLLKELHENRKHFALSNVIEKFSPPSKNEILEPFFKRSDLHVFDIEYHYRSSSYNKKNRNAKEREVLITNYK